MADLIIYNGSDKIIKRIVELLNQGTGGGGNVDDVKVNGTSVVDANKVAQIDLTPYAESEDLATVATSGSYNDLSNKPTDATQSASGLMSSTDKTKLDGIASGAEVNVQSDWSQSDNTADDYIKNKPTIPTVNDGTLTLKNGDQTKGTFSANQSTAANVVMLPFDITGNTTIGFTPVYPS